MTEPLKALHALVARFRAEDASVNEKKVRAMSSLFPFAPRSFPFQTLL